MFFMVTPLGKGFNLFCQYLGVSKNEGYSKMDREKNGKPY